MANLLEVRNLNVSFHLTDSSVLAVRDVSFSLEEGKTLGLVGESGCGKSVTAFSILRIVGPPGEIEADGILYRGSDILSLDEGDMRKIRGREIAMIFQEPMTSLNPVFSIGYQLMESIELHTDMKKKKAMEYAVELLGRVGIPNPSKRIHSYPHEFSGGMRQRVMIAMALSASPSILIADEPTTALDVTIQAQILDLLLEIQEERKMALLLITHDLGIVANVADDIAIMYAGEIMEQGETAGIFTDPLHPYSKGLIEAIPTLDDVRDRLKTIPGTVPTIREKPAGCVYHPRCPIGTEECLAKPVELLVKRPGRLARCIRVQED